MAKLKEFEVSGTVNVTVDITGTIRAANAKDAEKRMKDLVQLRLLQDYLDGNGNGYTLDGEGPWQWDSCEGYTVDKED